MNWSAASSAPMMPKTSASKPDMPRAKPRISLDLVYASPLWTGRSALNALLKQAAEAVADHLCNPDDPRFTVAVMLADDAEMRRLNAQFRNKDKATNVLSFPSGQDEPEKGQVFLGDIAIGFETVTREAEQDEKSFRNHLSHLMVHGLLHLMGYDHLTPEEAEDMEALEVDILATIGIPNPYAEFELVPIPPVEA
jgi:probable rRNA maturation factor